MPVERALLMRRLYRLLSVVLLAGLSLLAACRERDETQTSVRSSEESKLSPLEQSGSLLFEEVTMAGIEFVHENGARGEFRLREIMSGGGALVDVDSDGDLDLALAQSVDADEPGGSVALWSNDGDAQFSPRGQLKVPGYAMGIAAADYDGDGRPDLFVSAQGRDSLLRNLGDFRFRDVTTETGLGDSGFATSAVWFDADLDGDLDLYVARYVDATTSEPECRNYATRQLDYCSPLSYPQVRDLFYWNEAGQFREVGAEIGLNATGYGLAVVSSDVDGDGWIDLYVANDQSPAFLWINQAGERFAERALETGCAFNAAGESIAGMGIVCEDFDSDGRFDLFVTNIREESHLFLRRERAYYQDESLNWGRLGWTRPYTGFGVVAFDQNLDGWLDLYIANGAVSAYSGERSQYGEPDHFIRGSVSDDRPTFRNQSGSLPTSEPERDVSRGVAWGDLDRDGDLDLLVMRNDAAPKLLINQNPRGRWLEVEPVTAEGRSVLNAVVEVKAGGRVWRRETRAQQSYLSSGEPSVHFGLGKAIEVDSIRVTWPGGASEFWTGFAADRKIRLVRGTGETPGPAESAPRESRAR